MGRRTMDRRAMLGLMATTGSMLTLAGCGTGGPGSGPSVISYGTPGGDVEDKAWEPVFASFNGANDVQAEYRALGGNYGPEYYQKLQTLLTGGDAPDLFYISEDYLGSYADNGAITPIDDLVGDSGIDLDEFWPNSIRALTYEDQLYGLPRDGAPYALWYNVDLFEQARVDRPDSSWTWSDYLQAAITLTKRDDSGRALQLGSDRGDWASWVWQAGGDILDADKTRCLLSQPAAIEGLAFAQDLVVKHQVAPSPTDLGNASTTAASQAIQQLFVSGRMATYMSPRGSLGAICSAKFRFAAAPLPMGAQRAVRALAGPTVMSAAVQDRQAAFQLMTHLCSADGQQQKISQGYAYPSRRQLVSQDWFAKYTCGRAADTSINTAFTEELESGAARSLPTHPRWPQINSAIGKGLDALFLGQRTASQVGADMTAAIDPLLG